MGTPAQYDNFLVFSFKAVANGTIADQSSGDGIAVELRTHVGLVIDNAGCQKKRPRRCSFFGEFDQKSLVDPRKSDRLVG